MRGTFAELDWNDVLDLLCETYDIDPHQIRYINGFSPPEDELIDVIRLEFVD
jgi:hypothetical protein